MTADTAHRNGTASRVPPHDLTAERSLLGAMMLTGDALTGGVDTCTPEDFYRPAHGTLFHALTSLYRRGAPCDAVTVADELARTGSLEPVGGMAFLLDLMAETPSTTNARQYAAILARHALSRRLIAEAAELAAAAYTDDPGDLLELFQARLGGLGLPGTATPADLRTWDDFWDRPAESHKPWVIPSMIRLGWRAVIVATEGAGKTLITTQIALCAGQGIHPFMFYPIPPVRTLFIDLENPDEHLDLRGEMLRRPLQQTAGDLYQVDRTWVWHREGGMNIRSRPGRAALEAAIAHVRPQLVVIAPVYKMYRARPNETDEIATGEVQQILDDLRTRYQFALILEHHAPKGVTRARDMVPFGSSLWLRWPELGKALLPAEREGDLLVDVFRADRLPCTWPTRLERSASVWPWEGHYQDGMPDRAEAMGYARQELSNIGPGRHDPAF